MTPSMCLACRYVRLTDRGRLTCETFPWGIPALMLDGPADHRYPVPGDKGLRFDPADDAPNSVLSQLAAID